MSETATITISLAMAHNLERLAEEALQAMDTANSTADEPIYTSSSLSAALATLEELRATVRAQEPLKASGTR